MISSAENDNRREPPGIKPAIFVISLPGSTSRQQAIATQLERHNLAFSWLEGVNGRTLDDATLARLYSIERAEREGGRALSRGEIGCALSHLKAYQTILENDLEFALVLEDDAALAQDFSEQITRVCAAIDWRENDLVLLSHIHKYTDWGARRIGPRLRLVRPLVAYNGNGYLISRAGAQKLLKSLSPVYVPADAWNHLRQRGVLKIRGVMPYLVNHSRLSEESTIGGARQVAAPSGDATLKKHLKRALYDKFIYQLVVKPLLRIRKQPTTW